MLFVVSAPSGTGKGAVLKALRRKIPDLTFTVSYTTRPPRPGEVDRVDYHFTSREHFEGMRKANQLLEWNEFSGHYYGTPMRWCDFQGRALLEIDVNGAHQVKHRYPSACSIFLLPPSYEELERRLRGDATKRQMPEDEIRRRLVRAAEEISHASRFDHWVENDEVESAASKIGSIVSYLSVNVGGPLRAYRNPALLERVRSTFLSQQQSV
jgi:guanylate kinase